MLCRLADWRRPDQQVVVLDIGVSSGRPAIAAADYARRAARRVWLLRIIHPFKGVLPLLSAVAALDRVSTRLPINVPISEASSFPKLITLQNKNVLGQCLSIEFHDLQRHIMFGDY